MAEGRIDACDRLHWNHTSTILAMIHNVSLDKFKNARWMEPGEFNPYLSGARRRRGIPLKAGNIRDLKALFVDKGKR